VVEAVVTAHDVDVAIVGCGPVGVTLAGLLAGRGLQVVAFDREVDLYPLPRAAHLDHEVLRILQELGAVDEVLNQVTVNAGMDFLTADRQVLVSMRAAPRTTSGWPASVMFHQPSLETAMRRAAVAQGTELRLGVAVDGVTELDSHVQVQLSDGTSVSAAFVVGCDGARSMVRQHLDVALNDAGFEQRWLVLDLVLHEGAEPPTPLALQVCDPARPHTLVPMPPPRFRFEFMLLPGETDDQINTPERIATMVSPWLDPDDVTVERSAVYTFHGLVATPWRRGRVLLAGDAAHQMPPFLGQGMCSGLRDAANLAWKLERVIGGVAPMALLDTYEVERAPHVQAITDAAVFFGRMICTTDAAEAAQRDIALLAARAQGAPPPTDDPVPPLSAGPLVLDGGGALSVQVDVDGCRSDDVMGPHFAVVGRSVEALGHAPTWQALGATVLDAQTHPELHAVLDAAGGEVAVIRPDRRVLWVGHSLEPPSATLIELLGHHDRSHP
jgi:3-(3-hydroxy-phenyl)propionate hydroxylase